MKVALVHDYLTQQGGAERVFELLCKRFPKADIFTSVYDPQRTIQLKERLVQTTLLQSLPRASKYFRLLAPLYYPAFRALNFQGYDLIISSTSSFAKSVRKGTHAKHICFCHNVTRFLWDTRTYLGEYKDFQTFYPVIEAVFRVMRKVDVAYAQEPDLYIANSSTVARRIQKFYGKPAITINYPIDVSCFSFSSQKDDFYLTSARLLSYKRVDIIVEAFNRLGWKLIVTGDGPERKRLQSQAAHNITFLGHVSDIQRSRLLAKAKAVVVAALEDYGLVPIEANVSGTPVIAYGQGGILDTQVPGKTGLFFPEQTAESLESVLREASAMKWNYSEIRDHALNKFTEEIFFEQVEQVIDELCSGEILSLVS